MGTQQSKQTKPPFQWEWVENENGVEIYRNTQDGRIAERRRVVLNGSYTFQEESKVYAFRATNAHGLVKTYETIEIEDPTKQKQKISDLCKCSTDKIQLDVFTERIQHRLSQLPQLTFPEGLLILKQITPAFEVAFQKVGGLNINPELIGVTEKGEVRAWVNQNWALNRPSHPIPLLKSSSSREAFGGFPELKDETEMVNNLVTVISQKTQKGHFPEPFAEQLRTRAVGFRTLKRFLNEYLTINNITLPETIDPNKINKNILTNLQPVANNASETINKLNAVPQFPQQSIQASYQMPKFSFNHQPSLNSNPAFKFESAFSTYEYKPTSATTSYAPLPLSYSNFTSQAPPINTNGTVSNYKSYFSEPKKDEPIFKSLFSDLKFNLRNQFQPASKPVETSAQPINSTLITKPASPHYTLAELAKEEAENTLHNITYKINPQQGNGIQA